MEEGGLPRQMRREKLPKIMSDEKQCPHDALEFDRLMGTVQCLDCGRIWIVPEGWPVIVVFPDNLIEPDDSMIEILEVDL
jgi:hypothetical protein